MSKNFFLVFLVLTGTILFLAFQTQGKSDDNPKSKNEKILQNVGMLLEEGHLSPRKINDDFSKLVMKRFIADLDDDKTIFLKIDLDSFKRFESKIDDEIHGEKLESFYMISQSYTRRLLQASELFKIILSNTNTLLTCTVTAPTMRLMFGIVCICLMLFMSSDQLALPRMYS